MSKPKQKVTVEPGEGRTVILQDGRQITASADVDYTPEIAGRMMSGDLVESKRPPLPAEPRKKVSE